MSACTVGIVRGTPVILSQNSQSREGIHDSVKFVFDIKVFELFEESAKKSVINIQ